jgi:hypothetical protein
MTSFTLLISFINPADWPAMKEPLSSSPYKKAFFKLPTRASSASWGEEDSSLAIFLPNGVFIILAGLPNFNPVTMVSLMLVV